MEPRVPFEDYARPRPLRTYSHKSKAASSNVLPLLRTTETPTSLVRNLQRGPGARDDDCLVDGAILDEANACQLDDDFEGAHELEFEPQYASDTSQNPEDYATEDDASLEYSTDEDEDERKTPEQLKSAPPSSVKSSSSNKFLSKPVIDQSNRLRRRPFLLFDKLPPRGFKRLKPKSEDSTTSTSSAKYNFGDGFSKDEAKPNGLVQLGLRPMSKRKSHTIESKIGSLDLTQSTFQSSPKRDHSLKQKTMKKKKRDYDNSFLPDPKRAERQRKRQKQLKKDDPLKDKELLPPAPVPKPKMVLMSAILGSHSDLVEKPQHVALSVSEHQQKQIQNTCEDVLNEEIGILQQNEEEGNLGAEESTSREESVELGEFPVNELHGHSAFNHQQEHQQEQKAAHEQEEDRALLHSNTIVEKPVQEPPITVEPVREFLNELLKQPLENPSEEPSRSTVDRQEGDEQQPIHSYKNDPKPKTKPETEIETLSPVQTTTTIEPQPTRLNTNDVSPREQSHHRKIEIMASQEEEHHERVDKEAPTNENTSPGSAGWETYVSETDIHRTPTPPRPPLTSRAKSAMPMPTTSRGERSRGLQRANSAV
ncbi:hypothetical protein B0T20DRAFT_452193 [Sordaria brevicollis]|uniref:Uncharacterized protein n=1 Tax=Sordaria brevicollis TaxID=83679 RepID=A0AAE0PHL3_SORBR|nr:hypothetical protein B0T20DRAFT_452193 [Sordaria brevicollis]